jgi:V/A-type H+-transporting ATPase subunit I
MITKMEKITLYGVSSSRKAVMEILQKSGLVHITKAEYEETDCPDVSEKIVQFDRYGENCKTALGILDRLYPEKTPFLSSRETVSMENYHMNTTKYEEISSAVMKIIKLNKRIGEIAGEISKHKLLISTLGMYKELDIPLDFAKTRDCLGGVWNFQGSLNGEQIDQLLGECKDQLYYEFVFLETGLTSIFVLYHKSNEEQCVRKLKENGFVKVNESISKPPKEKIAELEVSINSLEDERERVYETLKGLSEKRNDIKLFYDHISMRGDKYRELGKLATTQKAFILNGFVPSKNANALKAQLEANALCEVVLSPVEENEEAPVLFSNNGFASPVEGITETYSLPSKHDIDPNGIMAFFYYLFFGMMFSDAGYGLLVCIACGYVAFFSKCEAAFKKTMKMFFFCGISTVFWGLMYGSFFGDAIGIISKTFFSGKAVFNPIWIDPTKEPLLLLIFSVALGLVQILIGLGIKFYTDWRGGDKKGAICDTLSWIFIIFGIVLFAASMFVSSLSVLKNVGIGLSALGVVIVILMKGRENKNPIIRFFSGILGLYDITSYVSDALSYSRLMALGLSTGVIASVVNMMGSLGGSGFVGTVMFVLVFIIGHALNFAINMLGAYVHTNRLQYVEFYSKFYEGGGKAFSPLKMNTKYFIFSDKKR